MFKIICHFYQNTYIKENRRRRDSFVLKIAHVYVFFFFLLRFKRACNFLKLLLGRPSSISLKTRVVCLEWLSSTVGFKPEEKWTAGARVTAGSRSPRIQDPSAFGPPAGKGDRRRPTRLGKRLGCAASQGLGHGFLDSTCKWLSYSDQEFRHLKYIPSQYPGQAMFQPLPTP